MIGPVLGEVDHLARDPSPSLSQEVVDLFAVVLDLVEPRGKEYRGLAVGHVAVSLGGVELAPGRTSWSRRLSPRRGALIGISASHPNDLSNDSRSAST